MRMTDAALGDTLVENLFRYLAVPSQSDARAQVVPSTQGQWAMNRLLKGELEALGASEVHLDAQAVLTAKLPGTAGAPAIGFCAHVDTVDVGLSPEIRPRRVRFAGADLCLNPQRDLWLRVAEHPEILSYAGQDVIVTDGTSVLGADNKAALAILMALAAELTHSESRGATCSWPSCRTRKSGCVAPRRWTCRAFRWRSRSPSTAANWAR